MNTKKEDLLLKKAKKISDKIKKHAKVTIDEHITTKEGVTFKLPSSLTN